MLTQTVKISLFSVPSYTYIIQGKCHRASIFTFCRPNWIKIYGEEYHRREFVHIGWQENDLPLFAKILDIITVEEFPFFVIEKYKSLGINDHLLGFLIQHTHLTCCINIADLLYKYVFSAHSYIGDGQVYIISKTHLELLNVPRLSVD